jgi:hypothetical protein
MDKAGGEGWLGKFFGPVFRTAVCLPLLIPIMKHRICWLSLSSQTAALLLASASLGQAQSGNETTNPPPVRTEIEQRWESLRVTRQPAPNAAQVGQKNGAERQAALAQEAARYATHADALREFYTEHPDAPQAAEAKRLEAQNLFLAAQAGDNSREGRWKTLANEVRRDRRLPAADRFAIAAQADYLNVARNRTMTPTERLAAQAQVARGHTAEFPGEPGGYEALLGLARSAPVEQGRALAEEVAAMPAPLSVKLAASRLAARFALVGQKISPVLTDAGYPELLEANKSLVIYTWATWSEGSQALAEHIATRAGGAVLLGLCLDDDVSAAEAVVAKRNLPGRQVYDDRATEGALAQALWISDAGWIYVIDRTGTVVTVRGQDDLNVLQNL